MVEGFISRDIALIPFSQMRTNTRFIHLIFGLFSASIRSGFLLFSPVARARVCHVVMCRRTRTICRSSFLLLRPFHNHKYRWINIEIQNRNEYEKMNKNNQMHELSLWTCNALESVVAFPNGITANARYYVASTRFGYRLLLTRRCVSRQCAKPEPEAI